MTHDGADVHGLGDQSILSRSFLGLVCSVQCPGSVVIRTFDAIRELRDAGVVVAGGFHSPMEMECLEFLLRGEQPVVVVLAKGLQQSRLPGSWRKAVVARRLLVLSPFPDSVRRTTKVAAQARNEFVAGYATAVLIPHASPAGKAEAIARNVRERRRPLFTFDDNANENLHQLGAQGYNLEAIRRVLVRSPSASA